MSQKGGRPSKAEIHERREKVRELFLKGKSKNQIAKITGSNRNTIDKDIQHIQAKYTKMVLNNPHLAQKQFARVERLLEEVNIIKERHWTLYQELEERAEENRKRQKEWEERVKEAEEALEEAKASGEKKAIREARRELDDISRPPRLPTYVSGRLDSLKAILDRVDKEAKLLSLFNPQQLIDKNYVSIEVLRSVMELFKGIIMDLIPKEKRGYAFKRLKTIDITTLNGEDVVDAEIVDDHPKKPKQK